MGCAEVDEGVRGGLVSWTLGRGSGYAIEVSGMSSFRGGVVVRDGSE